MSFESILQSIVDEGKGIIGVALMESDGIPIVQVHGKSRHGDPLHGDIGPAGVEFGHILNDLAKASDAIGGGPLAEVVVALARVSLVFAHVEDDIVLVAAVSPDGNIGKARYLIRRNLMAIRQEL
jgi:predicted regulator of Ras-like GTPase activity (Roadblock/LC7/MglB family)